MLLSPHNITCPGQGARCSGLVQLKSSSDPEHAGGPACAHDAAGTGTRSSMSQRHGRAAQDAITPPLVSNLNMQAWLARHRDGPVAHPQRHAHSARLWRSIRGWASMRRWAGARTGCCWRTCSGTCTARRARCAGSATSPSTPTCCAPPTPPPSPSWCAPPPLLQVSRVGYQCGTRAPVQRRQDLTNSFSGKDISRGLFCLNVRR